LINKEEHIKSFIPHVEKLAGFLKEKDVEFSPIDGDLDNVVFTRGDDVYKISHHSFYRFSGMSVTYKGYFKNFIKANILTEEEKIILAERRARALKNQDPSKQKPRKIANVKLIEVTEDMYINQYMRALILHHFDLD